MGQRRRRLTGTVEVKEHDCYMGSGEINKAKVKYVTI